MDEIEREAEKAVKLDRGPFRRVAARGHATMYRLTGGRVGGRLDSASGDRPILLLTTMGCKTGKARTMPLVYLARGDDWIVVGANAGRDCDPGWVHNLRADPEVTVRVRRRSVPAVAAELGADEAAELWPALGEMNAQYGQFRRLTDRPIPVVRLRPR